LERNQQYSKGNTMGTLNGKVALVTGAGGMKGIGRAIALKLASEGADMVITDVRRPPEDLPPQERQAQWRSLDSVVEEVTALGRRCHAIWCDLSVSKQIDAMAKEALATFGHIDILVNNARAITGPDVGPLVDLKEEVWRRSLDINTTGVFLTTQHVARAMIQHGTGGTIINIGSEGSSRGYPNMAAYCASKFAVLGMAQAAAQELAPHGIRVNTVCPGSTNTDRMNYWERDRALEQGISQEEFRKRAVEAVARSIPMKRIGESEDMANGVAFIASDAASFITGQALHVNGGTLLH